LKQVWDVIVLGAGAAGLMCALTAGQRGKRVLVLEKSNKVGKKILMSGGGRCNFTNLYTESDNFLSNNPHFCKSAISRYTQWDFIELVNRHRIPYHEKALGQLFCDNSSKDILAALLDECETSNVTIKTLADINTVEKSSHFKLTGSIEEKTVTLKCDALIVATGGLSIPSLGGSDFGYQIAKQFGHLVLPLRAGLVPFTFTDGFKLLSEKLSGSSVPTSVTVDDKTFNENILFSHRGLSGPAILQISSYWHEGETISIDILPALDAFQYLQDEKQKQPKLLLRNILSQQLPRKLVLELEQLWWSKEKEKTLAQMNDSLLSTLAKQLNSWQLKPAGTEGYRTAEVTLGGIDTNELSSKTMMSNKIDQLYFIGEVIDVTGHLGGFNFQWAWSSGYAAGLAI
jgi:predicted Rossmann fold flavoprotein|tara:strand:+ start:7624 stop:8823 length:1200 start_codon:yes stop_codon:yes gene_type:complete